MDTDISHETEKRLTEIEGRVAALEEGKPGKPGDEPDEGEVTGAEEAEEFPTPETEPQES